jgi:hypothetical protein
MPLWTKNLRSSPATTAAVTTGGTLSMETGKRFSTPWRVASWAPVAS